MCAVGGPSALVTPPVWPSGGAREVRDRVAEDALVDELGDDVDARLVRVEDLDRRVAPLISERAETVEADRILERREQRVVRIEVDDRVRIGRRRSRQVAREDPEALGVLVGHPAHELVRQRRAVDVLRVREDDLGDRVRRDVVLVDALRVHGQRLLEQVVDGEVDRIRGHRASRGLLERILRHDVDLCLADRVDVLEVAAVVEVLVGCREVVEVHAEARHEVHVGLAALVGVDRDGVIARRQRPEVGLGRCPAGTCENRQWVSPSALRLFVQAKLPVAVEAVGIEETAEPVGLARRRCRSAAPCRTPGRRRADGRSPGCTGSRTARSKLCAGS